jgi:hypothetical protein
MHVQMCSNKEVNQNSTHTGKLKSTEATNTYLVYIHTFAEHHAYSAPCIPRPDWRMLDNRDLNKGSMDLQLLDLYPALSATGTDTESSSM